ncbi:MAG: prepilin peptidase [Chloroflexi bacterium]|nr:prepilin peptidase [Chloroflexota bacterium]
MSPASAILFSALFGLAIGSFLNVIMDRLPAGGSLVRGRSHCDSCGRALRPWDLAPVASYLLLRGKCRYCGSRIPRRVLAVEVAAGLLFALAAWQLGATAQGVIAMTFASILIVVFVIDLEHRLVLDAVTYPSAAFALAVVPWGPVGNGEASLRAAYLDALYGVALGGAVLLLIYLVAVLVFRREAIGFGDVKLGVLLGVMLGFTGALVTLDVAFIGGGIVAILLLALKIRRRGQYIPFGPFLVSGALVSLFWGEAIFDWYWSLLS